MRSPIGGRNRPDEAGGGGLGAAGTVLLVVFWYSVTLVFNYTAFNLTQLKNDDAIRMEPGDITLIEMFACTICGTLTLRSKRLNMIPPPEVRGRMLALGLTNAAACRLFMMAMDHVALSLVQTIRACQPLFTVIIVYLCFGESYSVQTYLTLIPIVTGFGLAAGGDPKFEAAGFALSIVSTCCLVAVNTISRRTLALYRGIVDPLQVQAWATSGSFLLLLPHWLANGGLQRLQFALGGPKSAGLVSMVAYDGLAYHCANVGTFRSIDTFDSLSFAIIDTLRRLLVVCSGFVFQGNPCTVQNGVGILLVIAGAGCYNVVKVTQEQAEPPPEPTKPKGGTKAAKKAVHSTTRQRRSRASAARSPSPGPGRRAASTPGGPSGIASTTRSRRASKTPQKFDPADSTSTTYY